MKKIYLVAVFILSAVVFLTILNDGNEDTTAKVSGIDQKRVSGAGQAMDLWHYERAYPGTNVPVSKYSASFEQKVVLEQQRNPFEGEWESLGPQNIGGRMLCLAFHPTNPDIIYAGSASGGLWKTTTQGIGVIAWEQVPTGFPVLGVGAIAIDPNDPDTMYIGTGETYGVGIAEPGIINRYTRGTYGIGILKTTDGGVSWTQSLSFPIDDIKGVQDLAIDPQDTQNILAATTDGVYRSQNGGSSWNLVFSQANCFDIEIDPNNTDLIYVTQGNLNYGLDPNLNGIFKSTNGGDSFIELTHPNLLAAWSGNAKLAFDPTDTNILYASIQVGWFNTDPTTPGGIFKTSDGGASWSYINNQNIAQFQGWYSHDIAVNPANNSEVINVGIDAWKSTDFGNTFVKESNWQAWPNGQIDINVPQGGPEFVHADIHAVYYHPLVSNKVFYATDGGIFSSEDAGDTFETHNGGLQTGQFYANMGSSASDPNFLIAGAQDNNSYIYRGDPSWFKILGGDGMSASVNQSDEQVVYGSSQGLFISKSINGGDNFFNVSPALVPGDYTAFLGPYELAPSDNNIIYAGATYLYRSEQGGVNWAAVSGNSVDGGNVITKIAVSPSDPDLVILATTPDPYGNFGTTPKLLRSTDGGANFTQLSGLPNRMCKDIEFDPMDQNIVYAVFSGFGTDHVYRSTNLGNNWLPIDNGLPDVPTNTILIDPLNPDNIYVGNDLGVYVTENGGSVWESFNEALPDAVMIYDLNNSPSNRKLRIATHGHGIWQRDFINDPFAIDDHDPFYFRVVISPNPAIDKTNLYVDSKGEADLLHLKILDLRGRVARHSYSYDLISGRNSIPIKLDQLNSGMYFMKLTIGNLSVVKRLLIK